MLEYLFLSLHMNLPLAKAVHVIRYVNIELSLKKKQLDLCEVMTCSDTVYIHKMFRVRSQLRFSSLNCSVVCWGTFTHDNTFSGTFLIQLPPPNPLSLFWANWSTQMYEPVTFHHKKIKRPLYPWLVMSLVNVPCLTGADPGVVMGVPLYTTRGAMLSST